MSKSEKLPVLKEFPTSTKEYRIYKVVYYKGTYFDNGKLITDRIVKSTGIKFPTGKGQVFTIQRNIANRKAQEFLAHYITKLGISKDYPLETTIVDFVEKDYIQRLTAENTIKSWRTFVMHVKNSNLANMPISEITYNDLFDFVLQLKHTQHAHKEGKTLANNSINTHVKKVSIVLNAFYKSTPVRNPWNKDLLPKYVTKKRQVLTVEEVAKLTITPCRRELLKKAFLFVCNTGLRWGDLKGLDKSHFIREGHDVLLDFKREKGNVDDMLPINSEALQYIDLESNTLFQNIKYSDYENSILKEWLKSAGIEKEITFHSSRHTFANRVLEVSNNLVYLKELLGHAHITTTMTYANPTTKQLRGVVNILFDK
ncbi:MAG: tyrosine-type recombinase/integrase [Bacteroidia bacterium]